MRRRRDSQLSRNKSLSHVIFGVWVYFTFVLALFVSNFIQPPSRPLSPSRAAAFGVAFSVYLFTLFLWHVCCYFRCSGMAQTQTPSFTCCHAMNVLLMTDAKKHCKYNLYWNRECFFFHLLFSIMYTQHSIFFTYSTRSPVLHHHLPSTNVYLHCEYWICSIQLIISIQKARVTTETRLHGLLLLFFNKRREHMRAKREKFIIVIFVQFQLLHWNCITRAGAH